MESRETPMSSNRRTRQTPTATMVTPDTPEPRTRFTHLTTDPASPSPRPIRDSTRRTPIAMSVPPVETRRKPRNSPMSLSAFDDFMNPIVAGRAGCCLETLVPIAGGVQERPDIRPRVVRRPCLAMKLPAAIQRCDYSVSSREAYAYKPEGSLLRPTGVHLLRTGHQGIQHLQKMRPYGFSDL